MNASVQINVQDTVRPVLGRTRGQKHGGITRLMSPGNLGEVLKPFVFLDIFEGDMRQMQQSMPLHPHSGIATVTVFTEGDVSYDDPEVGQGLLGYGGVEFMRAGGGVWHGKELSAGTSPRVRGVQLWVTLPPELENGPAEPQYVEAHQTTAIGPARLILGSHAGEQSVVRAPSGMNYLMVRLGANESWRYLPPNGHTVAWLAMSSGALMGAIPADAGELVVFKPGEGEIALQAGQDGASLVLGSAVAHDYPLHLGNYSVHTSALALARGEARIQVIGERLRAEGRFWQKGPTPVLR
jgi:redox-sensitive bicupin YhaK (pirin superfamily)